MIKNIYQKINDKWTEWQERRTLKKVIIQKNEMEFSPSVDTTESKKNIESDEIEFSSEEVGDKIEEQAINELNLEPKIQGKEIINNDLEDSNQENTTIEDETEIEEGDLDAEKEEVREEDNICK